MRKVAFLLALVAVSVPAVPQERVGVPVDSVARAKFPKENGQTVDASALVNKIVNAAITPESDQAHYGVEDLWVMMPADSKGDCEDYALSKLYLLQRAGLPAVRNSKIVGVTIPKKSGGAEGHAILAVRLPKGGVMYLDNLNAEPMTRKELVALGYRFFDWRA
jgi:predicted transglutaminase-like cysteine proteinase